MAISDETKALLLNAVQDQTAKPIRRLSNRRVVYSLQMGEKRIGFVYNKADKQIEPYRNEQTATFQVGQKVWWKLSDGMVRTGTIVAEVPPKTKIPAILGQFKGAKYDHLLEADPRGQKSYLIKSTTRTGDKLEWPGVSSLRSNPIVNKTKPRPVGKNNRR